jgi:hypothetical protein
MSGNTTNLGKVAQTGTLIADTVRSAAMEVGALTLTGNLNGTSATFSGTVNANALGVTGNIASATLNTTGNMTVGNNLLVTTLMSSTSVSTGAITSTSISTGSAAVTNTITAQSFSQPDQKLGTAASPSALTTQAYSIAFTRYIFYFAVANNTQFNKTFNLT